MKLRYVLITLVALSLSSCRGWILENRIECPSFLFFDIQNSSEFLSNSKVYATVFNYPDGYLIDSDTTTVGDILDRNFYFAIKDELAVQGYGLIGLSHQRIADGTEVFIPSGMDSDPLFRFSYQSPTRDESFFVPVEFVKDHCKIHLKFKGIETFDTSDGIFPFTVIVKTNTRGIDGRTGIPLKGYFEYELQDDESGEFYFVLPRLGDEVLVLELYAKDGLYYTTGLVDSLDLYEILRIDGGIDWTAKNLPDLDIVIDYQMMNATVSVMEWEHQELNYDY